jgi:serine/threonine protein phosphatase PrpC
MGGQFGGKIASDAICEAFGNYFSQKKIVENPATELYLALMAANVRMREKIAEDSKLEGMGSTVIALLIHEETGRYSFLSVGDSPLYCYRGGGLFRLNANHSRYEDLKRLVAEGYLSPAEAKVHRERNMLTSAVTGEEIYLIDQKDGVLLAGEYLILASDGLQTLDDSADGQLANIIGNAKGDSELIINESLSEISNINHIDQDNTTIIIINFEEDVEGFGDEEIKPPTLVSLQERTKWVRKKLPLVPILVSIVILLLILVVALFLIISQRTERVGGNSGSSEREIFAQPLSSGSALEGEQQPASGQGAAGGKTKEPKRP